MRILVFTFTILAGLSACRQTGEFKLNLHPLRGELAENGLLINSPSVLNLPDYFVWGGSVAKGKDGKYHMLFALWEAADTLEPFQDSWLLYSKIGYAVSDHPDREFKFQKIILKGRIHEGDSSAWDAQMVHNPHVKRFGDTFYLYFIGARDPGPQPPGSPGADLSKRNRVQQSQHIGVIAFDRFEDLVEGNFTRPDAPILSPRTRVKADNVVSPSPPGTEALPDNLVVVNPSVTYYPETGKYHLYFKGNLWDPNWRGVHGVAISDSPTGPFTARDEFMFEFRLEDGKLASAEDPFVWYDQEREVFFAVIKDFSGRISGLEPGLAVITSQDGFAWEPSSGGSLIKKQIPLVDGSVIPVSNLERPQLLLDEKGQPVTFYAACSVTPVGGKTDGSTFNVQLGVE